MITGLFFMVKILKEKTLMISKAGKAYDNLKEKYHSEIEKVVNYQKKVKKIENEISEIRKKYNNDSGADLSIGSSD